MLRFRGAPIRLVTVDFTGTVMQFKDSIGQIYCNAAEELGITHKGPDAMNTAFMQAYRRTIKEYPCFGGETLSSPDWWDLCVRRTLAHLDDSSAALQQTDARSPSLSQNNGISGSETSLVEVRGVTEEQAAELSSKLYKLFDTDEAYQRHDDALHFAMWLKAQHQQEHQQHQQQQLSSVTQLASGFLKPSPSAVVPLGVVSNADERYRDAVIPALGFAPYIDFTTLSKLACAAKPAPEIFRVALQEGTNALKQRVPDADDIKPHEVLHVGDSVDADYLGIKRFGGHGVLLHRGCDKTRKGWESKGAASEDLMTDFTQLMHELEIV